MKVGLYFGSFNPIHIGHCIIASYVVNNTALEQVWLVVSPQNPFKPSNTLLNEYHRFHLAQLAVENEPSLKAIDAEFYLPRPSYTIDTLTYLKEKYSQHEFSVIMGSDSYLNLDKWKNAAIIRRDYELFIYERQAFPVKQSDAGGIHMLQAPILQISATQIRENIRLKKSIRYLVPDNVREEIERNGYYK